MIVNESIVIKDVYTVTEREGEQKDRWTRIGIGFVNRDNSLNVILDAYPANGRLHIRNREPKKQTNQTERRPA